MSKESSDATKLLVAFHRKVRWLANGKHGHAGLTVFSRVLLVFLVLCLGGPILGHAVATMPAGLAVFIGLALAVRVGIWLWGRYR